MFFNSYFLFTILINQWYSNIFLDPGRDEIFKFYHTKLKNSKTGCGSKAEAV